jgi:hypothetical protein
MDRTRSSLARGASTAVVSAVPVAGAAFVAAALVGPSTPDPAPAATFASDDSASSPDGRGQPGTNG